MVCFSVERYSAEGEIVTDKLGGDKFIEQQCIPALPIALYRLLLYTVARPRSPHFVVTVLYDARLLVRGEALEMGSKEFQSS